MTRNVVAFDDYARMGEHERIYSPSRDAEEKLAPLVPSLVDLHAETCRQIRAREPVEFIQAKALRHIRLAIDPDLTFTARRVYARIDLHGEDIEAGDVDMVRGACLHACRLIGNLIADMIPIARQLIMPPPGCSVTYATARSSGKPLPMSVRWNFGSLVRWVTPAGFPGEIGALVDPVCDAIVLRLASRYFLAPVGEEVADD